MFGASRDASNAPGFRKAECAEWDRVFQRSRFQRGDELNPMMSSRGVVVVPGTIDTVEQLAASNRACDEQACGFSAGRVVMDGRCGSARGNPAFCGAVLRAMAALCLSTGVSGARHLRLATLPLRLTSLQPPFRATHKQSKGISTILSFTIGLPRSANLKT